MANTGKISCPFCKKEFELTEAITSQIENKFRVEKDAALENQRKEIEEEIRKAANEKARKELDIEMRSKQEEIDETRKKLEAYKEKELELAKRERILSEQKLDLEIKHQAELKEGVDKAYAEAQEKVSEKYNLKIREQDELIKTLTEKMKEAQQKVEQGSQKRQGEILELELEDLLKKYFPNDEIMPVVSGKKGGDITQIVKLPSGKIAGIILWEAKRTKAWQGVWIQKLKDDQRAANADLAVIASEVIPDYIKNFGFENGIWITDWKFAVGVSAILRENLISISQIKSANIGKEDKAEMIFNYLTGIQFKQRVEVILEAYAEMRKDIDTERKAMTKSWAKRETQVSKFIENVAGMWGDLQGIGANMPEIKLLEGQ